MEEPGGLQFMGLQRAHTHRKIIIIKNKKVDPGGPGSQETRRWISRGTPTLVE